MKRTIIISALAVMATVAIFTSCTRTDEDAKPKILYSLTRSQDLVDMADMTVTYKDGKGNNVTEKITGKLWQKVITIDTVPCELGIVDYKLTAKPASELKKDSYELEATFSLYDHKRRVLKYDWDFNLFYKLINFKKLKRESVPTFIELANDHGNHSNIFNISKDALGNIKIESQGGIERRLEMDKRRKESRKNENRDTSYHPQLVEEQPVVNSPEGQENSQDLEEQYNRIQYSLIVTDDVLEVADIEVTYKGPNGIDLIDTITIESKELYSTAAHGDLALIPQMHWWKNVELGSIPAPVGITLHYLAKPLIEERKNKRYNFHTYMEIMSLSADSDVGYWQLPNIDGKKLDQFFEFINDNPPSLEYTLQRRRSNPKMMELVNDKK